MRDEVIGCRQDPDERELARLDLVGLACEVATLAARMAESVGDPADPRAAGSALRRDALVRRSLELLAPQMDFGAFTDAALEDALALLREDQQQMLQLRDEVERLLASWSVL